MRSRGRRKFLIATSALLAAPLARGQRAAKVYRIGLLQSASSGFRLFVNYSNPAYSMFGNFLAEHGYISTPAQTGQRQNVFWVQRTASEIGEQLPALAVDLVRQKVDVIVTIGAQATVAAKQATTTIPIVMLVQSDPVMMGLVASLGRPGGNLTGVTTVAPQLAAKRLELLKETVSGLTRVAVLWNSDNPANVDEWRETEAAAQKLGIELHSFEASRLDGLESVLDALRKSNVGALQVFSDRLMSIHAGPISELAAARRLPTMYGERRAVDPRLGGHWNAQSGLMSYGLVHLELLRRAVGLVAKILKGASPAELPVEQPRGFELVINLGTAKALGITVPPSILLRADRVIE